MKLRVTIPLDFKKYTAKEGYSSESIKPLKDIVEAIRELSRSYTRADLKQLLSLVEVAVKNPNANVPLDNTEFGIKFQNDEVMRHALEKVDGLAFALLDNNYAAGEVTGMLGDIRKLLDLQRPEPAKWGGQS
jgi:hypothetical protein